MKGGLLAGLLFGAAATGAILSWLRRADEPAAPPEAAVEDAAAPPAGAPAGPARREPEALAEPLRGTDPVPETHPSARLAGAWAASGTRIEESGFFLTDAGQEMRLEYARWIAEICDRYGVRPDEAIVSPDGLASLYRDLAAAADPPLTPEQRAEFEKLLAEYRPRWEKYLAERGTLSRLEQGLQTLRFSDLTEAARSRILTPAQNERVAVMTSTVVRHWPGPGSFWSIGGDRRAAAAALLEDWTRDLSLDAAQQETARALIDELVRENIQKNAEFGATGVSPDDWKAPRIPKLEIQIRIQKKMEAALGLTPAQAEILKSWNTGYDIRARE